MISGNKCGPITIKPLWRNMKGKFVLSILIATVAVSICLGKMPVSGTAKGQIDRVEEDIDGIFSVWLDIDGEKYQFMLDEAKVVDGEKLDLTECMEVRIQYENLILSEMDSFYIAEAKVISIIREKDKGAAGKNSPNDAPNKDFRTYYHTMVVEGAPSSAGLVQIGGTAGLVDQVKNPVDFNEGSLNLRIPKGAILSRRELSLDIASRLNRSTIRLKKDCVHNLFFEFEDSKGEKINRTHVLDSSDVLLTLVWNQKQKLADLYVNSKRVKMRPNQSQPTPPR